MTHSVYYSRGFWYAKREYQTATTPFEQMKMLTRLEREASLSRPASEFDRGIMGFVNTQRGHNAKRTADSKLSEHKT